MEMMRQRRALILYGSMTRNTEKVATWFKETFEEYGWDVTFCRLLNRMNWEEWQDKLYFDDYDAILLGSPIVGGAPIQPVIKAMSMGAGGKLESEVQTNLDKKEGSGAAPAYKPDHVWRRNNPPYSGILRAEDSRPLGVVFSTYGGGFYGSGEAQPVLETLKLYLQSSSVKVVGKFCCGGKETGPAGYDLGVKPAQMFIPGPKGKDVPPADVCDAVGYRMGDGSVKPGSYFFHYDLNNKPGPREEAKARAFAADFIEDYFMTYNGEVNCTMSELISMS
jgi:hypothetical protein